MLNLEAVLLVVFATFTVGVGALSFEHHNETDAANNSSSLIDQASHVQCRVDPNFDKCFGIRPCIPGIFLPVWKPASGLTIGQKAYRGVIFLGALLYTFVGIAIIAEHFMAAIEVIVSQTKTVKVKRPNGEYEEIEVRIWNATVSNLTLMALGTSAPEILLTIIHVCGHDFESGNLGPGTIVGSAAFNLFMITGVCMLAVKGTAAKKIEHLRVFFVTATWSLLAYVWLYIIISVTSPGVVEVWEAVITLFGFPITVLSAWVVDRKLLLPKLLDRKVRVTGFLNRAFTVAEDKSDEMVAMPRLRSDTIAMHKLTKGSDKALESHDPSAEDLAIISKVRFLRLARPKSAERTEQEQDELLSFLMGLRQLHPDKQSAELQKMAETELLHLLTHESHYFRLNFKKQRPSPGELYSIAEGDSPKQHNNQEDSAQVVFEEMHHMQKIFFEPDFYVVNDSVVSFPVTVSRYGDNLHNIVTVDIETIDASAVAGKNYRSMTATLTFYPGVKHKQVSIGILRNLSYIDEAHFHLRLSNPTVNETYAGSVALGLGAHQATVVIIDDNHGGNFTFANAEADVMEDEGFVVLKVCRQNGARGRVTLPYWTRSISAEPGTAYSEVTDGEIVFENNEITQEICIQVMNESKYEKAETFLVELGEPRLDSEREDAATDRPQLHVAIGEIKSVEVTIRESKEFQQLLDKIAIRRSTVVSTVPTFWLKEQFLEAIRVSTDSEDEQDEEPRPPKWHDYLVHALTIFWKLLFVPVPPTSMGHGWWCFWVSLVIIAVLSTLIADLAMMFGCSVGLKDELTAITFLAVGTSLPDMFASRLAAINNKFADAAVGNVTGSNAVNVFLGIGVAWLIGSVVHYTRGDAFCVAAGSLGFSVTVFCTTAVAAIAIMLLRRVKKVGGELGGPHVTRYLSGGFFFFLWILYLLLAFLQSFCFLPDL